MSIIYCPKLTNMDKFIEQFKEYLDTTYNISISKDFIQTVVKNNVELDTELNHITFKDSNNGFNYINTLFKNIFGTPLTNLIYKSVDFKNEIKPNDSRLKEKIMMLEKQIEDNKETIDEIRDAYIRVKRENEKLIANSKFYNK